MEAQENWGNVEQGSSMGEIKSSFEKVQFHCDQAVELANKITPEALESFELPEVPCAPW